MIQATSAIINGKAVSGDGPEITLLNPTTEERLTGFAEAGPEVVEQAAQAARAAFKDGRWRNKSVEERQKVLRQVADALEAHTDELSEIETSNTGIPITQTRGRHVGRAAHNFRFFADYIGQTAGQLFDQAPDHLTFVRRQPVGVAALIAPWNAPIALGSMKIAAALAFGNSSVVKPSEVAPLSVQRIVEIIHEAGVPEGVVNLVNGRGAITGDALVRSAETDVVSFTGGTVTGRTILATAGSLLKPGVMELGGKSANIIFDSADYERALDGALLGIFTNNGQQCLAGSRILVQKSIADRFIEEFVARAQKLKIGSPFDTTTNLGPVITADHRDRVLSYVDVATADGGKLLTGGKRASGFDKGYFIEPTVVLASDPRAQVCQDEIFGPFATILTFETPDEAFAIANDSSFGLVSYVWTEDHYLALRAQEELESGVVWINTPMMRELRAPFSGWKDSGVGAQSGRDCEAFYTNQKTVTMSRHPLNLPKLGK